MEELTRPNAKTSRSGANLRWAARIIGLAVTVLFFSILVGETVTSWVQEGFSFNVEVLYVLVPAVILLGAFILAWWKELLGGMLLMVGYLIISLSPSVHSIYYGGEGFTFYIGMFFFALPFLASGVLFILASVKKP